MTSPFWDPNLDQFRHQFVDTIGPTNLKIQSPFGSSGLERIGLEPCGRDVSKSIWLERARARGQESLDGSYPSERARRARSSQMAFSRVCFGGGNCERLADMVAQGALNVKVSIHSLLYIIILLYQTKRKRYRYVYINIYMYISSSTYTNVCRNCMYIFISFF